MNVEPASSLRPFLLHHQSARAATAIELFRMTGGSIRPITVRLDIYNSHGSGSFSQSVCLLLKQSQQTAVIYNNRLTLNLHLSKHLARTLVVSHSTSSNSVSSYFHSCCSPRSLRNFSNNVLPSGFFKISAIESVVRQCWRQNFFVSLDHEQDGIFNAPFPLESLFAILIGPWLSALKTTIGLGLQSSKNGQSMILQSSGIQSYILRSWSRTSHDWMVFGI